ncbi:UNVERIFIED_CONTAM: hypothetical protein PYX00_005550 [Menopon gallinae]|uniref:Uncharacterized protein n=1 Tax=Menopon gallinae TaxID=328185 RepID=A0AAW2HTJ2_9NEOP
MHLGYSGFSFLGPRMQCDSLEGSKDLRDSIHGFISSLWSMGTPVVCWTTDSRTVIDSSAASENPDKYHFVVLVANFTLAHYAKPPPPVGRYSVDDPACPERGCRQRNVPQCVSIRQHRDRKEGMLVERLNAGNEIQDRLGEDNRSSTLELTTGRASRTVSQTGLSAVRFGQG